MTSETIPVDTVDRLDRNLSLLQPGAIVTLDMSTPAGQRAKYRSYFIGYLPKQYVLIQCPSLERLGRFAHHVKQGLQVTVRGLVEGQRGAAVAFTTSLKQIVKMPSKILVLEFPDQVILQSLRKSLRIDTEINAVVTIDKQRWKAHIHDISVSGCQLYISNGQKLRLVNSDDIVINIEQFQDLYQIELTGEICNRKEITQGMLLGVQFKENCKNEVAALLKSAVTHEF